MSDLKVCVRMFAVARELAGSDEVKLTLPAGATIGDVRRRLVEAVPALAPMQAQLMIAMNHDYVSDDALVVADAELACIPPVSGG